MVFYGRHDGGPLFYRLSRRPESLGFGAERRARPYLKVDADATGTIHLALTEDSPFGSATSIYHRRLPGRQPDGGGRPACTRSSAG